MIIGYARVSTDEQNTKLQIDALEKANCNIIYTEKESGSRWERPELHKLIDQLRKDDVVVVYKLDRLSRSLRDLIFIIEKIEQAGAAFKSLTETIDTTNAAGKMMFHIVGAFAEFERCLLKERTKAGLEAAAKQGRKGGRPNALNEQQILAINKMIKNGKNGSEIARIFGVSPATISRHITKKAVRLTSSQKKEIIEMLQNGELGSEIAKIFSVSTATISKIKSKMYLNDLQSRKDI